MRIRDVLEGKFPFLFLLGPSVGERVLIIKLRAMVWAIDLDDGTLIQALGEASGRTKKGTITANPYMECFKGDW